jgi:adenosylcobinamide-phosphate synthase
VNAWTRAAAQAAGLLAGYALDAALGDPRRLHPVAGYGRLAGALERRMYAPDRRAGMRYTAIAVGMPVLAAGVAAAATRRRPLARAGLMAVTTWTVLGARSLRLEAEAMAGLLEAGDVAGARRRLGHLCGRDPSGLDTPELARATVESVAENTSDAVVAPLVWGAVAGLPGLVGYRAVNTLDAMVGHRSARYARFGSASARLDDVANLGPSRLTAVLTVVTAPGVGGSPGRAAWTWLRHGHRHPSPNAGQCEAAMAGALGVRLGGTNVYFGRTEERPVLGSGRPPAVEDVRRAARLSGAVGAAALALCVGAVLSRPLRHRRLSRGLSGGRRPEPGFSGGGRPEPGLSWRRWRRPRS